MQSENLTRIKITPEKILSHTKIPETESLEA